MLYKEIEEFFYVICVDYLFVFVYVFDYDNVFFKWYYIFSV